MDCWTWSLVLIPVAYIAVKAIEERNYFKKYGIPQALELPFLGILGTALIIPRHMNYLMKSLYNINKEAKYIGVHSFLNPVIVMRDLDLIKSVLVKNFEHFKYHKEFVDEERDPLFAKNLALLNGEKWREVRALLSPAFTSNKLRTMYALISRCAENFVEQFAMLYRDAEVIDTRDAFTRYASDVIATCAFGIEVDSLKDPQNEFYMNGRRTTYFGRISYIFKMLLILLCPTLAQKIGVRNISEEETNFFIDLIGTTIKTRDEEGVSRPDMLQMMLDAREKAKYLDVLDITAQAFIFFLAGFDTVSNQMCLIAHELAVNPDVQQKLQTEIAAVMKDCDGQPTFEAINNMAYLDAVLRETLRMHPQAFLSRMCSKKFTLPPALRGAKAYTVEPGTEILIPVAGIHADPDYYENPEKFDPERYLNKKLITSDATALGFGMGPRMCIGNRFGVLETKVLFVRLLSKCSLEPCKKTCTPMVYARGAYSPVPKGGFWLKLKSKN